MLGPNPIPSASDLAGVVALLAVLADPSAAGERLSAIRSALEEMRDAEKRQAAQLLELKITAEACDARKAEIAELERQMAAERSSVNAQLDVLKRKADLLEKAEAELHRLTEENAAALKVREAASREAEVSLATREIQLGTWSQQRQKDLDERQLEISGKEKRAEELQQKYEAKLADMRRIAG